MFRQKVYLQIFELCATQSMCVTLPVRYCSKLAIWLVKLSRLRCDHLWSPHRVSRRPDLLALGRVNCTATRWASQNSFDSTSTSFAWPRAAKFIGNKPKMSQARSRRKNENTAVQRLRKDYLRLCQDPVPYVTAVPDPRNILEWHYVLKGWFFLSFCGAFCNDTVDLREPPWPRFCFELKRLLAVHRFHAGPPDTPFVNGYYHGVVKFPAEFPYQGTHLTIKYCLLNSV